MILLMAVVFIGCKGKRDTGRAYMPDMAYSRAYESYATRDSTVFTTDANDAGHKIFYNNMPPAGTVKRGELFPFSVVPNNINGVDSNALINLSAGVKNPLEPLNGKELEEAGRLFNINCAICHGATGAANGPLSSKIGAIANLTTPAYVAMADGTMFYSIYYGKNNMGSYASQLSRKQRWMLVHYIRTLQPKPVTTEAATVLTAPAKKDSVITKKG